MNDRAYNKSRAIAIVSDALGVEVPSIKDDTGIYKIPQWDSLGQLKVILKLEKALGISIADESLFESLTSVHKISTFIASHQSGGKNE